MADQGENIREIRALMRLMDEPDPAVYQEVAHRILTVGPPAVPFLENTWDGSSDSLVQERIDDLLRQIRFQAVHTGFGQWVASGCKDLLGGCLLLARMGNPSLSEEDVHFEIGRIRKDVWLEINENLTALEQVRVFNHVFYELHGFSGNMEDVHAPENFFIDWVLDHRKGNSISLSILYMLVAQGLDLPVAGVSLPEHFLLAYLGRAGEGEAAGGEEPQVLFYINAYSKGSVYSRQEVSDFLLRLGHEPGPEYLAPGNNRALMQHLLDDLVAAYIQAGSPDYTAQAVALRALLAGE